MESLFADGIMGELTLILALLLVPAVFISRSFEINIFDSMISIVGVVLMITMIPTAVLVFDLLLKEQHYWWGAIVGLVGTNALLFIGLHSRKAQSSAVTQALKSTGIRVYVALTIVYSATVLILSGWLLSSPENGKGLLYSATGVSVVAIYWSIRSLISEFWNNKILRKQRVDESSDITKTKTHDKTVFQPENYWRISCKKAQKIFIGLGLENKKPNYVPLDVWQSNHMQVVGPTGTGKGVLLGSLAAQAILRNDLLVVIEGKRDRFFPHIVAEKCKEAGRQYHIVDLMEGTPGGWHPFFEGTKTEKIARIVESFGLMPTGDNSDVYKVEGKEILTQAMSETSGVCSELHSWIHNNVKGNRGRKEKAYLATWSARQSINPHVPGFKLSRALDAKEVIFLRTDLNDEELTIPLKAFLMQVCQWKFANPNSQHLTLIADEVSLYASPYLAKANATIRDTKTNLVLAYQSFSDLESTFPGPVGKVIRQRIDQNCQLKVFYGTRDNLTVDEVSKMSGTRRVWQSSEQIQKGMLFETYGANRNIRSESEEYIHANTIRQLPKQAAVLFAPDRLAQLVQTSPVSVHDVEDVSLNSSASAERTGEIKALKCRSKLKNKSVSDSRGVTKPNCDFDDL